MHMSNREKTGQRDQRLSREDAMFFRTSALEFMDVLCSRDAITLDVGASKGLYTERMAPHSQEVWAYEPLTEFAERLSSRFADVNVTVRSVALSDRVGSAPLYTPEHTDASGARETLHTWSSLQKNFSDERERYPDRFTDVEQRMVAVTTIDAESPSPVGLIKVDVEGAELEVLRGAHDTLASQQPILIVEIEDRHRSGAIADVTSYLKSLGYSGFFILDNQLRPIAEFSVETMQVDRPFPHIRQKLGRRINNFIYIPGNRLDLVDTLRSRLSRPLPED
jgi:FkbM family methyltransferase